MITRLATCVGRGEVFDVAAISVPVDPLFVVLIEKVGLFLGERHTDARLEIPVQPSRPSVRGTNPDNIR
jgi:hypothetical protein